MSRKTPPKWAIPPHGGTLPGVEVRLNDDGTIDEVFAMGFHLEQMDDGQYWIGFEVDGKTQHIMLTAKGKHIYPTVYL